MDQLIKQHDALSPLTEPSRSMPKSDALSLPKGWGNKEVG